MGKRKLLPQKVTFFKGTQVCQVAGGSWIECGVPLSPP